MKLKTEHVLLGLLRIGFGWMFLWAFLDKVFGLGFSTAPEKAWIAGGSPTLGFLSSSVGPFANFYHAIAGHPITNILFLLGLLCVGIALILGRQMKLAVWGGSLMLFLMWTAVLPPKTNPFLDDHILYILTLFLLQKLHAEQYLRFGSSKKKSSR